MAVSKDTESADIDEQDGAAEETAQKLNLDVKIDSRGACQRHITVTVPRDDIDRHYDKAFSELMPSATVPGFRAGRAPRKLVEVRFRKEVGSQVKNTLLMECMEQVLEDQKLAAISEPDLDIEAVEIPDDGPMTFEFDLEVRPEFDVPQWKGLTIDRPTYEFTDKDIDRELDKLLARHGRLVPFDGAASEGDYIVVNLTCRLGEETLAESKEEVIRIRPVLSFRDGKVEDFGKLMKGVKAGESRIGKVKLSDDSADEKLRGKEVRVTFDVLEVKKLELPELNKQFLDELGGFDSEGDLRDALKDGLERQLQYHQRQRARQQITAALTAAANWELPPDLLRRQAHRELERSVLELRRSGFGDTDIRAHENELRQNSQRATERSLKEHFILERIAEDEGINDQPEDYDAEIALIAAQTGESVRRVRAQLEKRGAMDILRNQIIERKVIDQVLANAKFKDVAFKPEKTETEAIDQSVGSQTEDEIPEAKAGGEATELPQQPARD